MRMKMQYRVRVYPSDAWGPWQDLPHSLSFSDVYVPQCFEFRVIKIQEEDLFIFDALED